MRDYLLARLKEPSTWRGIIFLASALGATIRPDLAEAIIILGVALAGGVAVATPDGHVGKSPGVRAEKGRGADVRVTQPPSDYLRAESPRRSGREDLERWER